MILSPKINPMDWYNTKLLNFIPAHFVCVKFHHYDRRREVLKWIEQNTAGRFAIERIIKNDKTDWLINDEYQIGFENPVDATMYTMFFR